MQVEVKVPQLSESVSEATLRRLAQEGRRGGQARREPDRHRDRQGRARAARARRRRAREDREGRRRARVDERRGDRADRHRGEGAAAAAPAAAGAPPAAAAAAGAAAAARCTGRVAMPAAAKIAAEKGVDPAGRRARGRDGRVTKGDVLGAPARRSRAGAAPPPRRSRAAARPAPAIASPRGRAPEQRVPMSRLRAARRRAPGAVAVDRGHPHHLQRGQHGAGDGAAQALQGHASRRSTA